MLVWDSEASGPIHIEKDFVLYAKLLWEEGKENREIIAELRTNGLSLRDAAYVIKYLEVNFLKVVAV